jgi:hypothetical protein
MSEQKWKDFEPGELGRRLGQARRAREEEARKGQARLFGDVQFAEWYQFDQKENGGKKYV